MRIFRTGLVLLIGIALVAVAACQPDGHIDTLGQRMDSLDQRLMAIEAGMAALRSGETGELTTDNDLTGWEAVHVMEVTVGPKLLDCVGVGPRKCLEVNGQLFYEGIDGFKHEDGYTYRLKIERYDAFPDEEEPPQDASRYGYRLIEVISKTGS